MHVNVEYLCNVRVLHCVELEGGEAELADPELLDGAFDLEVTILQGVVLVCSDQAI